MFHSARFKLTAWYLLIIMIISISFSAVIYRSLTIEVERFDRIQRLRIETRYGFMAPGMIDPTLIEDTEKRIVITLLIINVSILVVSGVTGYFLAGLTLTPIKEMVDEQNRFISDASHEIRTPLTSLKSAFEVYLREKKPTLKEANILVKESITEVNKLQYLSQSLLQLNQHQNLADSGKFEKVSIKNILDEAIKKVAPIADQKQIVILPILENYNLYANKYAVTDLFVILLDNAIKYSLHESKVKVVTKKKDNQILVSIIDHGIGIDEKDLPHIFDRFYRADTARSKQNSGGYGLGLSIAKKIADKHGGTISIKSEVNKGSVFTVHLPI